MHYIHHHFITSGNKARQLLKYKKIKCIYLHRPSSYTNVHITSKTLNITTELADQAPTTFLIQVSGQICNRMENILLTAPKEDPGLRNYRTQGYSTTWSVDTIGSLYQRH